MAKTIREAEVQDYVMDYYAGSRNDDLPPANCGRQCKQWRSALLSSHMDLILKLKEGDFVLLDMWAKMDVPAGVYSDLTKVGFMGENVPVKYIRDF